MNEDIRISLDFWDHHKTIRLKKRLGYEGIEALTRLWFYAAKYRPDGHLTNMNNEDIAIAAHWNGDPDKFVAALADPKYPWLDKNKGCFCLHNWQKRNGYACFSERRSAKSRYAAEQKWLKYNRIMLSACPEDATGIPNAFTPSPSPSPSPNPNPSPNTDIGVSKDTPCRTENDSTGNDKEKFPPCPYQKILFLYHEKLPEMKPLNLDEWTATQKGWIRKIWNAKKERQSLEWWSNFFEGISHMPFLMGQVKDWKADLLWIVKPENFSKIIQGKYIPDGNEMRQKLGDKGYKNYMALQEWLKDKESGGSNGI